MNKPLLFWAILLLSVLQLRAKTLTVAPSLDADFTSDVTVVCAGDAVHFSDLTTENPTEWAWDFDGGTPNISTLQNPIITYNTPGVYTVHLKSNNASEGDQETKTEYIKVLITPSSTFNITSATAQCNNSNSFSFVNTGSSTGSHFWGFPGGSPINSSAVNPSGVVFTGAGTHDVSHKVTDDGCTSTTIVSITIFSSPTALAVTTSASNCAGSNGTITIGATTSGTAPFTYSVNGSSFSPQTAYTGFAPGTYSVTVKDAHGCTFTRTAIVGSSGGPTAIGMVVTPATCSTANGIINITSVTGGAGPYTYSVDNSAFSFQQSYSNLTLGIHQVRVKDGNGCLFTQNINILNTQPTAVATSTTPTACVGSTGTITLGAVTGGRSPYSFSVDGGSFTTTTNYSGLAAGTHTIVVKDITGCSFTTTVTITTTPGPTTFASTSTFSKCSSPTGSINVQVPVGGTAPFTYSFNGGAFSSTQSFTALAAGTYTVVAKDANGCTISQTIVVNNTPPPTAIAITTNASACSASTGALTLGTVTGGTPPYSYSVDGSGFTANNNYTNLAGGTHTVVVKDANGCTFTTTATIGNTQPTGFVLTTTSASCNPTGSITIGAVTGGVAPLVYSVNNSSFTSTTVYNNLPAGTYTVSVKDFNGCVLTQTVSIGSTTPTALATSTTTTVCGGSTGTVTLGAVTAGVSPFTYSFNGSAFTTTTNYAALAAGAYSVTVKDATNCTFTTSVIVNSNAGPAGLVVNITPATCGSANGSITVGGQSGGTAPFTYSLDNGAFTSSTAFTNVTPGTHSVRVQDASGCVFTISVTVVNATGPADVALTSSNATCGNSNGTITVGAVTGGTAPFTYSLDGGPFTAVTNYTGRAAGSHTLTVKDANNCTLTKTHTIVASASPTDVTLTSSNAACGNLNGTITVGTVTGGTAPFIYSLDGGGFTATTSYTGLAAGSHTITVKDANNCTFTKSRTVATTTGPTNVVLTSSNTTCGNVNGTITVGTVIGGTAPFTYSLDGGAFTTTTNYTGLATGSHTITVKDANNCTFTKTLTVIASSVPTDINFTLHPNGCSSNSNTGFVTSISVTGGVAPYTYSFNGSAFTSATGYIGLAAGTYTLIAKDANGCTLSENITIINVPNGPSSFTSSQVNPGCGLSNGSLTITSVTGGTAPYTYIIGGANFSSTGTNATITGMPASPYSVNIRDDNGCETAFSGPTLVSAGGPSAMSFTTNSSTCGQPNGSVTVTSVTGGVAPYQYSLNGSAFTNSTTFSGVNNPSVMPLVVKDTNGCTFARRVAVGNTGQAPVAPVITQSGFLLTSNASTGNQWLLNGIPLSGSTGQTYLAEANGSYTVFRIAGNCTSPPSNAIVISNLRMAADNDPAATNVESNDARNEEQNALNISEGAQHTTLVAYPNPNDGTFTLSFAASENTVYTIEIVNVFGQIVFAEQVSNLNGTYTKQLDLSAYGAGIYSVVLTGGEARTVEKIVTH